MIEACEASEHLALVAPAGALYAFPAVVGDAAKGFDDHDFALEMLETEGVLVVPGSSFNVPYRNHFRVTLLPEAATLREVFARIDRVLSRRAEAATKVVPIKRKRGLRRRDVLPSSRRRRDPVALHLAAMPIRRRSDWIPLRGMTQTANCRHRRLPSCATSRSATPTPSAKASPKPGRWPMQLARALRDGRHRDRRPAHHRHHRLDHRRTRAAIDAAEPLGEYDFVSLLIGVNNQYRGRDVDEYRASSPRLLRARDRLRARRPRSRAGAVDPGLGRDPVRRASGRDPARIADELDAYNAAAREVCARARRRLRRHHRRSAARAAPRPAMLAEDGLHPSAAMYARMDAAGIAGRARHAAGDARR